MTPNDFLRDLKQQGPAPIYLFLGSEPHRRGVCRKQLIKRVLGDENLEAGLTRHDLDEVSLTEVIDDARSLSLFAPNRLILAAAAEAAVPGGRSSSATNPSAVALDEYVANPVPSVVLVLEANRFELHGEGKKKLERVQKFFSAIPKRQVIEFAPYTPAEAHRLAAELAKRSHLNIGESEVGLLVDAVGYDAGRIRGEIEKLSLALGEGGKVGAEEIARFVPSARAATIFELVAALGRGDRRAALEVLDTLVQEGEYLPLALSFLESQFRHALVARELGLRTSSQIQAHFQQAGIRIWFKKAQEIAQTASAFSADQLKRAVGDLYRADRELRDARPDDRTVVERFVLGLHGTKSG